MLRTLENIVGYRVVAQDGEIGKVADFFVDDTFWRLRYLVVETGRWLDRRRVLIAPAALGALNGERREFSVNLTREQVQNSPGIDADQPVSRQQEMMMNAHYGWPAYWSPEAMVVPLPVSVPQVDEPQPGDPHLRSFREISAYSAKVGELVLNVQDFIIEDQKWGLEQIVLQAGGWLDSRVVAVPVASIQRVSWSNRAISMSLTQTEMEQLPAFSAEAPVNQEQKLVYFDYCGRPVEEGIDL